MKFYLYDQHARRVAEIDAKSHIDALEKAKERGIHAPMVESDRDIEERRRAYELYE